MSKPSYRRTRGPLAATEISEGAVLAGLAVVLTFFGSFVPVGGVLVIAAISPYAVLAYRHRARATFVAATSGVAVLMVVLGPVGAVQQFGIAALGQIVGSGYRRGRGRLGNSLAAVFAVWVPAAAVVLGALFGLEQLRELILEQILIIGRTAARVLGAVGLDELGATALSSSEALTRYWWLVVPGLMLMVIEVVTMAAHSLSYPALARVRATFGEPGPDSDEADGPGHRRSVTPDTPGGDDGTAGAVVPVRLVGVGHRYPGADRDALRHVDMTIEPGRFVVLVGDNGSGKSTVLDIVAGLLTPSAGTVQREGGPRLGEVGGTAVVFQRPETQVLGTHVREDVLWGLDVDEAADVDVAELLETVGLAGMGGRETAGLSGGELQRLAIAGAMARRPALLLSDESTAMLDAAGRREVVALLRHLADTGTAVVHVTHHETDTEAADVVHRIHDGILEGTS